MIVEEKETTESTASIALRLLLNTKPCYNSFNKLKKRFAEGARDSKETARAKRLLLEMVKSAEIMVYRECSKCKRNHEISLADVKFVLLEALLEICGWTLLPNFENA